MNAGRDVRSLVSMASRALNLRYFGGVRILFDGRMAILATQDSVNAGRMFGGIDRNAFDVLAAP
jgi:hypothetical protein